MSLSSARMNRFHELFGSRPASTPAWVTRCPDRDAVRAQRGRDLHNEHEYTTDEDIVAGLTMLTEVVNRLCNGALED